MQAARDMVRWLHPEWQTLTQRAFRLKDHDRSLGTFSQHGLQWFFFNHGDITVFLIGQSGALERIGEAAAGLDQRLGNPCLLLLLRIEPDAWAGLLAAVSRVRHARKLGSGAGLMLQSFCCADLATASELGPP